VQAFFWFATNFHELFFCHRLKGFSQIIYSHNTGKKIFFNLYNLWQKKNISSFERKKFVEISAIASPVRYRSGRG
jgi:hypothetical protein